MGSMSTAAVAVCHCSRHYQHEPGSTVLKDNHCVVFGPHGKFSEQPRTRVCRYKDAAWALCIMGVCVAALLLQWQLLEDIPDQEHWVGGLPALPGRSDQVSASSSQGMLRVTPDCVAPCGVF